MNKTLLVSLISSIHLFLFGGSWDTCLAQELRSEVRQSTNAVEGLKVFPSVDKVLIEWSVDQPISNVNFILERKGQEGYYEIVAAIKSTRQLSYTLVDSDPPTRGTVVYRIRQQERGTYIDLGNSRPLFIHWNEVSKLNVYPNPVADIAYFDIPNQEYRRGWSIRISSRDGQSIYQGKFQNNGLIQSRLDVQAYRPGTYFLHLSNNEQHWVSKFIKL